MSNIYVMFSIPKTEYYNTRNGGMKSYESQVQELFTDKEKAISLYKDWAKGLHYRQFDQMFLWEIDPVAQTHTDISNTIDPTYRAIKQVRVAFEPYARVMSISSSRITKKGITISLSSRVDTDPTAISIILDTILAENTFTLPVKFMVNQIEYKRAKGVA